MKPDKQQKQGNKHKRQRGKNNQTLSNIHGTEELNRFGKPKGTGKSGRCERPIGKQRQRKEKLMEWFVPYMNTQPDQDAPRMWEEMRAHAEMGNWHKLGNVVRKKWLKMGRSKHCTTFLDNVNHSRHVWNVLIGNEVLVKRSDGGVLHSGNFMGNMHGSYPPHYDNSFCSSYYNGQNGYHDGQGTSHFFH